MGSKFHALLPQQGISAKQLKGKAVAIDGSAWVHKALKVTQAYGQNHRAPLVLMDKTHRIINHLRVFLYRTVHLLKQDIWPVFCFDGAGSSKLRNKSTKAELHERHEALSQMHTQAAAMNMVPLAREIGKDLSFMLPIAESEVTRLLDLLGIPTIRAPGEGEAQCSWLALKGLVNAVVTTDADALLYGAPSVIQDLAVKNKVSLSYTLDTILRNLCITRQQLVDLAILVGTDYNTGVPGIGPKSALKLLKEHGAIENIAMHVPNKNWHVIEIVSPQRNPRSKLVEEIREKFLHPLVRDHVDELEWHQPDPVGIDRFLLEEHSMSASLVHKAIGALI